MISRYDTLAVSCFIVLAGCLSSGDTANDQPRTESTAADSIPPDFEMVFGEGGGFSGEWSGHTIRADGAVYTWHGPVAESNQDSTGTLDPDSLARIWLELQDIGFFSDSLNEKGNISAFVRVTADDRTRSLYWVPGVEALEPPRYPIEALYRRTRSLVGKLR